MSALKHISPAWTSPLNFSHVCAIAFPTAPCQYWLTRKPQIIRFEPKLLISLLLPKIAPPLVLKSQENTILSFLLLGQKSFRNLCFLFFSLLGNTLRCASKIIWTVKTSHHIHQAQSSGVFLSHLWYHHSPTGHLLSHCLSRAAPSNMLATRHLWYIKLILI